MNSTSVHHNASRQRWPAVRENSRFCATIYGMKHGHPFQRFLMWSIMNEKLSPRFTGSDIIPGAVCVSRSLPM